MVDTSVKQLKKASKKDPSALFELGLVYYYGKGVAVDPDKAFKCFRKSVKMLDSPEVKYYLGLCYEKGVGVKNDYKKAGRYYRAAGDAGHAESKVRLGYLYRSGLGRRKDETGAFELFFAADELGSVNGRLAEADCYLRGEGTEADEKKAVEIYRSLADTNVRAAYDYAYCFHTGKGVEKNTFMAAHYLVPAATRGDADAQCFLAQCFFKGDCVKRNLPKAAYWFKKAAAGGSSVARFNYAYCLENGLGVERDAAAAFKIYEQLFESGYVRAASATARCYYIGVGVKQSLKTAVKRVKFGCKHNDPESLCYMGWFRLKGIKCRKNEKKAYRCFAKAYDLGSAAAAYAMSKLAKKGRSLERAQEYAEFALNKGYPAALYDKAKAMPSGEERNKLLSAAAERDYIPATVLLAVECEKTDPQRSFALWNRAYELGSLRGAYGLARCYECGTGVAVDKRKAFEIYKQAGKSGYADAIAAVGRFYQKGLGVECKKYLARKCFEEAARKGSTYAQCRLARMYAKGDGVRADMKKAEKLYAKAIALGDGTAAFKLAEAYCLYGGKKFVRRAVPVLEALVGDGDMRACALLAEIKDKNGDDEGADALLKKGLTAGCANAYYYAARRMLASDPSEKEYIEEMLDKAVAAGSLEAAETRVKLYSSKRFADAAKLLLAKEALFAFDEGDDYYYEVGRAYESGKSLPKDENKAARYFAFAYDRKAKNAGKAVSRLKHYRQRGDAWMKKSSAKKCDKAEKAQLKAARKQAGKAAGNNGAEDGKDSGEAA